MRHSICIDETACGIARRSRPLPQWSRPGGRAFVIVRRARQVNDRVVPGVSLAPSQVPPAPGIFTKPSHLRVDMCSVERDDRQSLSQRRPGLDGSASCSHRTMGLDLSTQRHSAHQPDLIFNVLPVLATLDRKHRQS
jgi:hypothetical protein